MLKKQKETWGGVGDALQIKGKDKKSSAHEMDSSTNGEQLRKNARQKLIDERNHQLERQLAKDLYESKAQEGFSRKAVKEEKRIQGLRDTLARHTRQRQREQQSCVLIQKVYRGHIGRKAASRWSVRRKELEANAAIRQASAITLQRCYRGRLGRMDADRRRLELAEFVSQMRAQEAIDEEKEYWRQHRFAKLGRKIEAFYKGRA